jgi:hypothetical protein
MRGKWGQYLLFFPLMPLLLLTLLAYVFEPEYAYLPSKDAVLNHGQNTLAAFDLWGQDISPAEAQRFSETPQGQAQLSPHNGAVAIDAALLQLGRKVFYTETFGKENAL